jgi:hypothetical protein
MLRIVAFIQCDLCADFLSRVATVGDPRRHDPTSQDTLDEQLHELRLVAEEEGWRVHKDSTEHYCSACWRPK